MDEWVVIFWESYYSPTISFGLYVRDVWNHHMYQSIF